MAKKTSSRSPRILVLNGPNLNLLGTREPDIYGDVTLKDIYDDLSEMASTSGYALEFFQSNSEGALIDRLHEADKNCIGAILNPAGYTHTSVALRDAISAISIPVVEVHISNVHAREEFRHKSLLAPVCMGQIVGFGPLGYSLALIALMSGHDAITEGGKVV